MSCDDVGAMVLDTLASREPLSDPALLAHLDSCAACRAVRDDYETMWRDLGGLATVGPSPDARARFALRFAAARLAGPSRAPRPAFPWNVGAVAAAALIAGLTGYGVGVRHVSAAPVASDARATEPTFLMLLHEDSTFRRGEPPVPRSALVAEYARWAEPLERAGTVINAAPLPAAAIWLGAPHAPTALGDGIDGFFMIRAKDRAEAERVAATCPHLKHGGRIELRLLDRS